MADQSHELALVEKMASFRHDPLGYVLYAFPWGVKGTELEHKSGPRAWQRAKLERIGRKLRAGKTDHYEAVREATVSGHGSGKSAVVGWLTKFALDTLVNTKVVVTANTEKQLQTKTWPELAKWHNLSITRHWFTFTATSLYSVDPTAEKTWRADAIPWSENNTEAFAGLHNEGRRIVVIFDEASKIADKVWEVAEGALTDAETEILWFVFGNGTRSTGRFRECFRRFSHRWEQEHIDSREVEGTNKELFAQWIADYGEDSDFVKVRVRGMFPAASLRSLISEADVDPAYGRGLREEQFSFAPVIISCDPAWEGDDPLVIMLRQGLMSKVLLTMPKNDNDTWVANKLALLEDEYHADAVFVDGGFGTGIISAGRTMGRNWTIVWFGEKADDAGYLNKRAEMWGKGIRNWLKEGGALPLHPQLREDLLGPETVPRADGKIQLEAKKDMKARGIPSPNYGDALALTFAHPVMKKDSQLIGAGGRASSVVDYDPYASTEYA
jgi:hypothetical protein